MKLKPALLGAAASLAFVPMAMADGHSGERGRDGAVSIIYWQAPMYSQFKSFLGI